MRVWCSGTGTKDGKILTWTALDGEFWRALKTEDNEVRLRVEFWSNSILQTCLDFYEWKHGPTQTRERWSSTLNSLGGWKESALSRHRVCESWSEKEKWQTDEARGSKRRQYSKKTVGVEWPHRWACPRTYKFKAYGNWSKIFQLIAHFGSSHHSVSNCTVQKGRAGSLEHDYSST